MMNILEKSNKITFNTVVNKVVYYNKETGWGVFTIDNKNQFPDIIGHVITVSGNFPNIYEECSISLTAHEVTHPKYGRQLEVDLLEIQEDNKSKASIINFLTKSSISGIDIQNAKKIYAEFGENSINVVLHETPKIKIIHGIGNKTYEKVLASVEKYVKREPLIQYCTKIGIPYNVINLLYHEYGLKALKIIQTNPYRILETSETLTFSQVDDIALKSGIAFDADERLFACLLYTLKQESILKGSTGCISQDLCSSFLKVLKIQDKNLFQYTINKLSESGEVIVEYNQVFLADFYNTEKSIANFLVYMCGATIDVSGRYSDEIINEELNNFSFQLNEQQVNTIHSCLENEFNIITGCSGVGKTSITKALVNIFSRHGEDVFLLSPTGKAARRLEECTGKHAETIHKFIGLVKGQKILEAKPKVIAPTNATIIVDEASMMDVVLFKKVIEACQDGTRLILVGDIHQLPSVQAGNVLEDIIRSEKFNVNFLTEITRQAEDSNIIKYCTLVNNGKVFANNIKTKDFIYKSYNSRTTLLNNLKNVYQKIVRKVGLQETQVICSYKKGTLGLMNLNKELKAVVNDAPVNDAFDFNKGDKVRHIKNNYDKDIFNGETGIVTDIHLASDPQSSYMEDTLIVNYGTSDKPRFVEYVKEDIQELQLAFASTIHASQGSEYGAVIVVIDNEVSNILLIRKLLYTALSRAKKLCILLGIDECVNNATINDFYRSRITKLCDFLKDT